MTLVDGATDAPVSGAAVWIPGTGVEVLSDDVGQAELTPEPDVETDVVVRTADGIWARSTPSPSDRHVRIVIPHGVTLDGTVVLESGEPAADVELIIRGIGGGVAARAAAVAPAWNARSIERRVTTDGTGAFAVPGLTETAVAVLAADAGVRLVGDPGQSEGSGGVRLKLPARGVVLRVATGSVVPVRLVDDQSGHAVGSFGALAIDWPANQKLHGHATVGDPSTSTFDVFWPVVQGVPRSRLEATASAPGYIEETVDLRWPFEDAGATIRLRRHPERASLFLRKPWDDSNNLWDPLFHVLIDGVATRTARFDGSSRAVRDGAYWVLAGLEAGRCEVRCFDHVVALVDLAPGGETRVDLDQAPFSRLVVRMVQAGAPVVGEVNVILRVNGALSTARPTLDDTGTFSVWPLAPGEVKIMARQSNAFSEPRWQAFTLPGGGESVEVTISIGPK